MNERESERAREQVQGEGEVLGASLENPPSFPRSLVPSLPLLPSSKATPRARHVPERTCVACRGKFPQSALHRFRKGEAGWTLERGVNTGRSLYVCVRPECHVEKKLRRAFRDQAPQVAVQLAARASP